MNAMPRRSFLKRSMAMGAGLTAATARAGHDDTPAPHRMGVLVDTTVCIGCRNCEWACKQAHDLPTAPLETYEDPAPLATLRRPDGSVVPLNLSERPPQAWLR